MPQIVPDNAPPHAGLNTTYSATILVVDDNPNNLRLVFSTLQHRSYRVLASRDARAALARLDRAVPDLILLDIMMPGMDGFTLHQQLRQNPKLRHIPVIFLSALADDESIVQGLAMDAVDFIAKPFHPAELLARVDRHLELARLRRRLEEQANRLSLLNEIALSLSDITDPDSALDAASTALGRLFRGSDIAILIRDEQPGHLWLAKHPCLATWQDPQRYALAEDTLLSRVLRDVKAHRIIAAEISDSPFVTALQLAHSPHPFIAAPMIAHGQAVGALLIIPSDSEFPYQDEDLGLAETAAAQMAGAIESAQLFKEIQARHQALGLQQRFTHSLLEASPGPVFVKDREQRLLMVNRAFAAIYGVHPDTMLGKTEEAFNQDLAQIQRFHHNNREAAESGRTIEIQEELIPAPDGSVRWYKTVVSPFFDEQGHTQGVIGSLTDITAQKRAELQLAKALRETEQLAHQDGLTGLANRRQLDQRLQQEWQRARRDQQSLAVLMVDVDYFKQYNDRYGHLTGDDCLRAIAQQLNETVQRPADLCARYGGEEFVVLMPATTLDGARQMAQALHQAVHHLAIEHLDAPSQRLSISIGIAAQIPHEDSPQTLLEEADSHLYQAKLQGRDRIVG